MSDPSDTLMTDTTSTAVEMRDDNNENNNARGRGSSSSSSLGSTVFVDPVLEPLLQASKELAAGCNKNKTKNISSIRSIVLKVLSSPTLFTGYDQIRSALQLSAGSDDDDKQQQQQQQNAGATELKRLDDTLALFSYGTIGDYNNSIKDKKYLPLNDAQIYKLRQLTLMTLVQKACENKSCRLEYGHLQEALALQEPSSDGDGDNNKDNISMLRAVEDILISCVYGRVVTGQLCQKTKSFFITTNANASLDSMDSTGAGGGGGGTASSSSGGGGNNSKHCISSRDVPPSEVSSMLETVNKIQGKVRQSRRTLQNQQNVIHNHAAAEQMHMEQANQYLQQAQSKSSGIVLGSVGGGGNGLDGAAHAAAAAVATGQIPPPQMEGGGGTGSRRHAGKRSRGGGLSGTMGF